MIVRDEQAHIGRCLASVNGLADEIVVVDTGSTDRTRDIAREFGATVFSSPWESDFSQARNRALDEAHGRWILILDADEQLLERDRLALFQLVGRHTPHEGSPRNAFKLLQKNSSDGGCTGMLVSTVRLFPNRPEIRYEWPIHEQVVASLTREGIPIEETSIEVLHDGYSDPSRNIGKQARNRDILQRQVDSGIEVYPVTHFLLAGAKLDLGYPADALRSYQDCIRVAPAGDGIAEGARVRVATCLNKLGRQAEALAGMPSGKSYGDWHPELLKLKGDCERALGNSGAAREAYRGVLGLLGTAFIPPCWLR